jgi:diacylglycerol kinase
MIAAGFTFEISATEWLAQMRAIGMVHPSVESLNTAAERRRIANFGL